MTESGGYDRDATRTIVDFLVELRNTGEDLTWLFPEYQKQLACTPGAKVMSIAEDLLACVRSGGQIETLKGILLQSLPGRTQDILKSFESLDLFHFEEQMRRESSSGTKHQRVFISYRRESEDIKVKVRQLAEALRDALSESGYEVVLDHLRDGGHESRSHWARWALEQAATSSRVLIIGTPGWFRTFDGQVDPQTGPGSAYEVSLISHQVADARTASEVHRVVYLTPPEADMLIPEPLQRIPNFTVPGPNEGGFSKLVASILGAPEGVSDVTWPDPPQEFQHKLADRSVEEWPTIVRLLSGELAQRVLLIQGSADSGKSALLKQCKEYAGQAGIPVVLVDFHSLKTIPDVLDQLRLDFEKELPRFAAGQDNRTLDLLRDLRAFRKPLLVLLDAYEHAMEYPEVVRLVEDRLIPEVRNCPGLAIIVAGEKVPKSEGPGCFWTSHAKCMSLGPITNPKFWEYWFGRAEPESVPDVDMLTLLRITKGAPGWMASLLETIRENERNSKSGPSDE